jgi:hypothetical protein
MLQIPGKHIHTQMTTVQYHGSSEKPKEKISSQKLDQWKREKKNNYYIYRIRTHPDTIWTGKKHSTQRERERERERERQRQRQRESKTEREKSRNK